MREAVKLLLISAWLLILLSPTQANNRFSFIALCYQQLCVTSLPSHLLYALVIAKYHSLLPSSLVNGCKSSFSLNVLVRTERVEPNSPEKLAQHFPEILARPYQLAHHNQGGSLHYLVFTSQLLCHSSLYLVEVVQIGILLDLRAAERKQG